MRPETIAVQLLANDEPTGNVVPLSESNEWNNTWSDIDTHQSNGQIINYSVEEVNVPDGYESTVSTDDDRNMTITNTYVPELTEVTVTKVWDDSENQDGVRPNNVTVNLLDGSRIVESIVLNENNDWQYTFSDLPKFAAGEEIQYSITENTVEEYSTSIETTVNEENTGQNSVITNTYTPEETTKDGEPADSQQESLPNTGEAQNTTLYLGGILALIAGASLIFITRRKNKEE